MKNDLKQPRSVVAEDRGAQLVLEFAPPPVSIDDVMAPTGYKGLSSFHKYWGKKPIECLGYLVEQLTDAHDLVIDPFVGSGLIARECALRGRRFIGIDINPISIELTRMISDLPSIGQFDAAMSQMCDVVRQAIDESYALDDGKTASHHLWDQDTLKEVWISHKGKNGREVRIPTQHDRKLSEQFSSYQSRHIRPLRFFQNSRINTKPTLTLSDLFTGRALRNIDLIIESIPPVPERLRRALLLTLTAAIGQMSSMVFAITGRGKKTGERSGKVEVGSWVIGYWRPPLHFEINVWNCFQRRANKLITALSDMGQSRSLAISDSIDPAITGANEVALLNDNCISVLQQIPESSAKLVLTDPPHSDRIPYLELSELWNAVLGKDSDFSSEIVVSNAREREKTKVQYTNQMQVLIKEVDRVLVPGGSLSLLFNARDSQSWNGIIQKSAKVSLQYYGCFPMAYSANSVVQDNRKGAMKSDYVLIYRKPSEGECNGSFEQAMHTIPGWSNEFPQAKG
ncbi:MAG: DNA methyltransferase [Planctomycetes bacterium]|nr:DNA methyltransferase [Planctomycetota bacterium]